MFSGRLERRYPQAQMQVTPNMELFPTKSLSSVLYRLTGLDQPQKNINTLLFSLYHIHSLSYQLPFPP